MYSGTVTTAPDVDLIKGLCHDAIGCVTENQPGDAQAIYEQLVVLVGAEKTPFSFDFALALDRLAMSCYTRGEFLACVHLCQKSLDIKNGLSHHGSKCATLRLQAAANRKLNKHAEATNGEAQAKQGEETIFAAADVTTGESPK